MALVKQKIGDLISPYNVACNQQLSADEISGVNREKDFFEPARQVGADTTSYKVVPSGYFACNLMHVGRDVVLPIAYNSTLKNKIVSPAYTIFCVQDQKSLNPFYLSMMMKSQEMDRYFWFFTDSSVRDGLSFSDFCEIGLALPSLDIQQKYVNIYKAMIANLKAYERGLEDLKLTFDSLLDKCKHSSRRIRMNDIFEEIDIRNTDGHITDVQGINKNKSFMPTVADVSESSLEKYKIIKNGQFAFSGMQTGRDRCIRISLYNSEKPALISPAYSVFKIKSNLIIPEFVMMWFLRPQVDRLGWFISDSSIRSNLDLDRFYDMTIPVPTFEEQQSIVKVYKAYNMRKNIVEKMNENIKSICPVLIQGAIREAMRR